MNQILSTVISILSIGALATVFIQSLKYVLSPNYRLQINRKKHTIDSEIYINYYQKVYKQNSTNPKSSFELQKLTNAAFGTKNFSYELIFMLLDKNVRDVEQYAKMIQNHWILIKLDYQNKKIECRLNKDIINHLIYFLFCLFFLFSTIIIVISLGYEWHFLRGYKESNIILTSWFLIFINTYFIYTLSTLKALDKIIDWQPSQSCENNDD